MTEYYCGQCKTVVLTISGEFWGEIVVECPKCKIKNRVYPRNTMILCALSKRVDSVVI